MTEKAWQAQVVKAELEPSRPLPRAPRRTPAQIEAEAKLALRKEARGYLAAIPIHATRAAESLREAEETELAREVEGFAIAHLSALPGLIQAIEPYGEPA